MRQKSAFFVFLICSFLYEIEVTDKHILFPLFSLQQILPENFEQNIIQIMTIMCLITDAFLCKQNKPKYIYVCVIVCGVSFISLIKHKWGLDYLFSVSY